MLGAWAPAAGCGPSARAATNCSRSRPGLPAAADDAVDGAAQPVLADGQPPAPAGPTPMQLEVPASDAAAAATGGAGGDSLGGLAGAAPVFGGG